MKLTRWDVTDYLKTTQDALEYILAEFEQCDTSPTTRADLIEVVYRAYKRWGWK